MEVIEMIGLNLNKNEYQILQSLLLKEEQQNKEAYLDESDGVYSLVVKSRERLDSIFERITELLQKEGFDRNYDPTPKGIILEGLIDKINVIE